MNSIRAASSEFGARSDQRCMALGSRDSQGLMGNVYSAPTEVIFRPEHLLQQQSKTSSPDERHYPRIRRERGSESERETKDGAWDRCFTPQGEKTKT